MSRIAKVNSTNIIIWLLGAFFYAYQYALRVLPNVMADEMIQQFSLTSSQFGQMGGIYYIGYSLMHIPLGIMIDRFQLRKILPAMVIICLIGLLPLLLSDWWVMAFAGRLILGCGSAAAILGTFKIIGLLFPQNLFSKILGLTATIGLLGAIYGGAPLVSIANNYGWNSVIWSLIVLGIILSIVFYLMIPNLPTNNNKGTPLNDILFIISKRNVFLIALCAGLMVGALEGFADIWGAKFIRIVHGYDMSQASTFTSLVFFGMCFGAPAISYLANILKSNIFTLIISNVMMSLAFVMLIYINNINQTTMSIITITIGVFSAYQVISITMICNKFDSKHTALASSIANMIGMIFGYLFHSLIGVVINYAEQLGYNDKTQYILGIGFIPIFNLVALFILVFIWLRSKRKNIMVAKAI